jgi:hypothetical protein
MIDGAFHSVSPRAKPIQSAATRFLIGRAHPIPLERSASPEFFELQGHRVICDTAHYRRPAEPPSNAQLANPKSPEPRVVETASIRRPPPPIHFLSNLPKTPQASGSQFNVAEGRVQAKRIREKKERFANRNEVRNELGQPVKVADIWLQSFLTVF